MHMNRESLSAELSHGTCTIQIQPPPQTKKKNSRKSSSAVCDSLSSQTPVSCVCTGISQLAHARAEKKRLRIKKESLCSLESPFSGRLCKNHQTQEEPIYATNTVFPPQVLTALAARKSAIRNQQSHPAYALLFKDEADLGPPFTPPQTPWNSAAQAAVSAPASPCPRTPAAAACRSKWS